MAGFFCLGGRDHHHHQNHPHQTTTPNKQEEEDHHRDRQRRHQQQQQQLQNLYLYRSNDEISNKGFEIWPSQYHQQQAQPGLSNYVSFGITGSSSTNTPPTTTTAAAAAATHSRRNSFNINDVVLSSDDPQPPGGADSSAVLPRLGFTVNMMRQGGLGSGGMNCQDCGNQAKKDCSHLRCRTCCKSRGFQCQTHVKSTWVPAAKRRERQQQLASLQALQNQQDQTNNQVVHFRVDNSKRQRDNHQGSASLACTTTRLPTHTSGLELGGAFPAEVNSPAVFRCVRVSAMDDADEHYAYQTALNIGGHVFRGILYDQGPDGHFTSAGAGEGSSGRGGGDDGTQQLNLTATTSAGGTNNNNPPASTMSLLHHDPSSLVYPTPINAFMAGTQFFPPPRS